MRRNRPGGAGAGTRSESVGSAGPSWYSSLRVVIGTGIVPPGPRNAPAFRSGCRGFTSGMSLLPAEPASLAVRSVGNLRGQTCPVKGHPAGPVPLRSVRGDSRRPASVIGGVAGSVATRHDATVSPRTRI